MPPSPTFDNNSAFSPDGKTLASGGNRTIELWDSTSGKPLKTLEGHSSNVTAVAFSPDGKIVASVSADKTIKLWDSASGKLLKTLEGHSNGVTAVAFSLDGKTLASASADSTIKLWDSTSGKLLKTLEGHSNGVTAVAFSLDGKTLASGGGNSTIKLWDNASGELLKTLEGHSSNVTAVAFSPDGRTLASASLDRTIKLWGRASGELLKTLEGHSDWVTAVAFSPDGKIVASGCDDTSIRFWRVRDGTALATSYSSDNRDYITFSPQGYYVSSAGGEKFAAWRIDNEVYTFEQYSEQFNRPDLISRILGGGTVAESTIQLAKDFPPTLFWLNEISTTDSKRVDIVLKFRGSSNLDHLFIIHNDEPVEIELPNEKDAEIRIPLNLNTFENRLRAIATDKNRLKSDWLRAEFRFSGGQKEPGSKVTKTITSKSPEQVNLGTLSVENLPHNSTVLDWWIDGGKVEGLEISVEDGQVRLRAEKGLLGRLKEGAHSLLLKIKDGARSHVVDPVLFWNARRELVEYAEDLQQGTRYAVVIGIGKYNQRNPRLKDLGDAPKQAKALGDYLKQSGFVVKYFLDDDLKVSKEMIDDYLFRELNPQLDSSRDVLFFYFGGHGVSRKNMLGDPVGYLLPHEYEVSDVENTTISMTLDVKQRYTQQLRAKHILFAIDACLADVGLRNEEPKQAQLSEFTDLATLRARTEKTGRHILTAGSDG